MTELLITEPAKEDLLGIWFYIAESSYLQYADEQLDLILKECELLTHQPEMGVERTEVAEGLRCFPVSRYNIYYRYQVDIVIVVHIVAAAQDLRGIEFL